jgi:hypothetical protein
MTIGKYALLAQWGMMLLLVAAAKADGKSDCGKDCPPVPPPLPPRQVCFNLVCNYDKGDGPGYGKCQAAATFTKWVEADGSEIQDNSDSPQNPQFEVECDEQVLFNSSGRRFTDEQGTRIQAETGPYPSLLLPVRSLEDTHRYVLSSLELTNQTLSGYCYIWSGAP